jgi:hypothetical protein
MRVTNGARVLPRHDALSSDWTAILLPFRRTRLMRRCSIAMPARSVPLHQLNGHAAMPRTSPRIRSTRIE